MHSSPPTVGTYSWARVIVSRTGYLHRRAIGNLLKHNPGQALPRDLFEAAVKTLLGEGRRGPKVVSATMCVPGWEPPGCPPTLEEIEAAWYAQNSTANSYDGSRRPDRVQTHVKKRRDAK
jgi:hypothetical protein